MANRILLKGSPIYKERPLKSSKTILPGMLCEYSGSDVQPHALAGGNSSPLFAIENAMIGDDIDTSYDAAGETVLLAFCHPGDEVNALLKTGNNVAIGDLLESDGAGALKKHTPQAVAESGTASYTIYARGPVGRALEAINNTSGANVRIKVEVL